MRALRLEMLADAPLAYLETLDEAAARSHEEFRRMVAARAAGDDWAQFIAEDGRYFVAHAAGVSSASEPGTTLLVAVYVAPAYRGTGLLGRIVDAVAEWSRAAGRYRLLLEVVTGNHRAVRAYARLGFVDTGHRAPHPRIPVLTELSMARDIR
jgi:predicted GNAT family acetyltransferase